MYTLVMDFRAESDLERLSPPIAQRIRKRLEKLCQTRWVLMKVKCG